jgi:hypothetical protein
MSIELPFYWTFNTGRCYTKHGQTIDCCLQPCGHVAFFDKSRFITGVTQQKFAAPFPPCFSPDIRALSRWVMARYDRNDYNNTCVSDWDGKQDVKREYVQMAPRDFV